MSFIPRLFAVSAILFLSANSFAAKPKPLTVGESVSSNLVSESSFTLTSSREQAVSITATSDDFDGVLRVTYEGATVAENDDYADQNPRVVLPLADDVEYTIILSTYEPGSGGAFQLAVEEVPVLEIDESVSGVLNDSSYRFEDNTAYSEIMVRGEPDSHVRISLMSGDFDSYVAVIDLDGTELGSNDDYGNGLDSSLIVAIPDSGYLIVLANTSLAEQFGEFRLAVSEASDEEVSDYEDSAESDFEIAGTLTSDEPVSGRLDNESSNLPDGSSFEYWLIEGEPGQRVTASMESDDFDAYLLVVSEPERTILLEADDRPSGESDPLASFYLPESGQVGLVASTFDAGEFGEYRLQIALEDAPRVTFGSGGDPTERYALLVGVEEYPDPSSNLPGVGNDVTLMRDVLIKKYGFPEANIAVLRDNAATRRNLTQAFATHLSQAGPDGTAVFFYSGHGTQADGNYGIQAPIDPEEDGLDEAIVLFDGVLLDDEIGVLIDRLNAGNVVVMFDSCNSGSATRGGSGFKELTYKAVVAQMPKSKGQYIGSKQLKSSAINTNTMMAGATVPARHVFLAASREDQLSWIHPDEQSSIFTRYLTQYLAEAPDNATFIDVVQSINGAVADSVYDLYGELQQPRVEGKRAGDRLDDYLKRL